MKKKVLFLCTGNSARSQMAEAILNSKKGDKFIAFSAGTKPADGINPLAVKAMMHMKIDISSKKPKPVEVFASEEFDFIITLCDKGKEQCISYVGKPIFAHWALPDPADFEGTEKERMRQFDDLLKQLVTRINLFINLPLEKLERLALEAKASEIGTGKCSLDN